MNPGQRALWLAHLADPCDPSVHLHRALVVGSTVQAPQLKEALARLMRAVPYLRARCFSPEGLGAGAIEIVDEVDPDRCIEIDDIEEVSESHLRACMARPFDVSEALLFRMHVFRHLRAGRTTFLIVAHHLVLDGIAFDLIVTEMLRMVLLDASAPRAHLAVSPHESTWRASDVDAWRSRLGPLPSHPAGLRPFRQERSEGPVCAVRHLSDEALLAIDGLRRDLALTSATLMMGVFAAALHKVLDLPELLLMTQVDTRTRANRTQAGMLVNTLPVRSTLHSSMDWLEFFSHIRDEATHALKRRHEPLEEIVAALRPDRRFDRSTVFTDFEFSAMRQWRPSQDLAEMHAELFELFMPDPGTRFGISMNVITGEDGRVIVKWALAAHLYSKADLEVFHEAVEALCTQAGAEPQRSPACAEIVHPAERSEILALGTGRQATIPTSPITARFLDHAHASPDAVAIRDGSGRVSYASLERYAMALAAMLVQAGVGRGDRVAVCCARGLQHVGSLLATLHLGAVYVPLDPVNPWSRMRGMLQAADPVVLMTDRLASPELTRAMRAARNRRRLIVDLATVEALDSCAPPAAVPVQRHDPAYVIFTSGSTGKPKGVEVGVGALLNHLCMMEEEFGLRRSDCVAQTAELGFDIHIWQILSPLWVGGEVHVCDTDLMTDPEALLQHLSALKSTVVELVPSYLAALTRLLSARTAASAKPRGDRLRHIISTGEPLTGELASSVTEHFPAARLTNAYGPAEAADDVTFARFEQTEARAVSIGRPARNVELLVLDRWRCLRPLGLVGELAVAGPVIANGYIEDPGSESFFTHAYRRGSRAYATGDRCILTNQGFELIGRADGQVKLGGRRIELGEIEAALGALPGISEARAVLAAVGSRPAVVAYVATSSSIDPDALKEQLSSHLPAYMLPREIRAFDALPTGGNGKVDRATLEASALGGSPDCRPPEADASCGPPKRATRSDPIEALVREHWIAVLPNASGSVGENFFAAGGDSLRAADLVARMRVRGVPAPIRSLFEHQELGAFAQALRTMVVQPRGVHTGRECSATPRQLEMLAGLALHGVPPLQAVLIDGPLDVEELMSELRTMVVETPELRLAFIENAAGPGGFQERPPTDARTLLLPAAELLEVSLDSLAHERALLERAAGRMDIGRGCHIAVSFSRPGPICLVVSHLVCDLVGLRLFLATLDERLSASVVRSASSALGSSFMLWAHELARRSQIESPFEEDLYRSEVGKATKEMSRAGQASRDVIRLSRSGGFRSGSYGFGSVSDVVRQTWPAGLDVEHLRIVALSTVALATGRVLGLSRVRVDLDVDGREVFSALGIVGDGMGCFTLLRPVVVELAPTDESLLRRAELALATLPQADRWDCLGSSERQRVDADLTTVPLLNVVGRSLALPRYKLLHGTRVSTSVPAWNARVDPHGVAVDVALEPGSRGSDWLDYRVTVGSPMREAFGAAILGAIKRCSADVLSAAARRGAGGQERLPDGLDLLDLGPRALEKLLEGEPLSASELELGAPDEL
ncbi:MAG: amino acid adenylation domain-containing protein [Solirubrobacteraceae bacterium]